jgi:DNA-binding HxlR family transcriptional regulator
MKSTLPPETVIRPVAGPEGVPETPEPRTSPGFRPDGAPQTPEACTRSLSAIHDTLYVLGGKWKLPIIIALFNGPQRFRELQRSLETITPKVLSKELKELELNEFVIRTVYPTTPVTVQYQATEYSRSLGDVLFAMRNWGEQHRARLKQSSKARRAKHTAMASSPSISIAGAKASAMVSSTGIPIPSHNPPGVPAG